MRDRTDRPAAVGSRLELLDPLLERAVHETGAYAGGVYLLAPGEQVLRLAVMTGFPRLISAPWERMAVATPTPMADAVRERRLVWLGVGELERRYPRAALSMPYPFAQAAAPLTTGDTVWGGLLLLWSGAHPPKLAPHELDALTTACHRLGLLLQQAEDDGDPVLPGAGPRLLDRPHAHQVGPTEALAAVAFAHRFPEGACSLDLEGRVTFVNAAATAMLGGTSEELLGRPPWETLSWLDDPVFEDRYRAAVVSRHPTSFTTRRPPDRWLAFQLYPDATGVSVRIIPTDASGRAEHRPPGAAAPSGALTRAGALYHLMHLAATLTEAISVRDVTDLVADQLVPAFGAQAIALLVSEGGRMRVVGSRGYPPEVVDRLDGTPLTSATPTERALTTGESGFFSSRAELEAAHPDAGGRDDMAAWAFLPLVASGRPVGSCVLAYDHPHSFTPDERTALTSLAGLIAQALDRARVYDAKHRLVQRLQTSLLPGDLPRVPGLEVAARYLPATRGMDIGGDFYDLIRLDGDTAAAVIGDVQGHDVIATALMGQVRTAVHAHATAGVPPNEVLARTNRLLVDLDPGLFTSCLYVQLDLAQQRARMATAGHPPPLLRHPDRRTDVLDMPPGMLLGIDEDADYPVLEFPLPPGVVLALYTDGLVEAPGIDLDRATAGIADRLARAPEQSLGHLADTLLHHAQRGHHNNNDDIALLLLSPQPVR